MRRDRIDLGRCFAYAPGNAQRLPVSGSPFCFLPNLKAMSDEAHLSAEQSGSQAAARVPQPRRDGRWPQGAGSTPGPRSQEAQRLIILSKRSDFLAANAGRRVSMPGFILLVRPRGDGVPDQRIGFTVTKRIGNAVVRNRMKRRMRALARDLLPAGGIAGADHVLIGRTSGVERDFAVLRQELGRALEKAAW